MFSNFVNLQIKPNALHKILYLSNQLCVGHHHRANFEGHKTTEYRRNADPPQSKWTTKGGSPKR